MADARKPDPPTRLRGPLEGYRLGTIDVPVRIFNLTRDGCFVEISVGTMSGNDIRLQIDLPGVGWTVVHCQTLHIAGPNAFAVQFDRLDEDTRSRIGQAIDRQPDRPADGDATAIDGEANDA